MSWKPFALLPLLSILAGCETAKSAPPTASAQAESPPSAAAKPSTSVNPERVEVTADGFQPSHITLKGKHSLVFRRTTEETCATAVVFPSLGIEKPLPMNTDVVFELPPDAKGEVGFQCGMGMYKSKLVVD